MESDVCEKCGGTGTEAHEDDRLNTACKQCKGSGKNI